MKAKTYGIYVTAVLLFLLSFFAGVITFAQVADKSQIQQEFRRRLSESDGIYVLVRIVTKEKSEEASMMSQLQGDAERELEDADVKIISKEDIEYAPDRSRLGVYLVMYQEPKLKDL